MGQLLDGVGSDADLLGTPWRPELLALVEEQLGEVGGPGIGTAERRDRAQAGGEHAAEERVVLLDVEPAGVGVGEPPVAEAAGWAAVLGEVAGER
jgi:hypothetical protein